MAAVPETPSASSSPRRPHVPSRGVPLLAALGPLVDVRRRCWSSCCWSPPSWPASSWCATRSRRPTATSRCRGSTARSRCCATTTASRRCTPAPATTCSTPRASCRRRTGSSRWTSGGTRPPAGSRRCSARAPSRSTRRSAPWAGGASRSRSCPGSARRPRPTSRRSATGSTPTSTRTRRRRCRWSTPSSALQDYDYQVEDWTPADSVAWLKAMAWDLRGNMDDEIQRGLHVRVAHAGRDRRAVPAVPLRPAPADRRPGRRGRQGLRAGRHRRRHPQAVPPAAATRPPSTR